MQKNINLKKYFLHKGAGANMYQFHQMHTQICMTLTRGNLMVRRTRLIVWSQVLKKDGYVFNIPFILLCNWIKQAEIVKTYPTMSDSHVRFTCANPCSDLYRNT